MQLRTILAAGAAALAVALAAQPASAALITAPTGSDTAFPLDNYFGAGPIAFGAGITWSSSNASNQGGSVFGYTGCYGFGSNGTSCGGDMAGLNDSNNSWGVIDTMTFDFATPVSAVGGLLNWYPDGGDNASIAVYDAGNNLIESVNLMVGGVNQVAPNSFYGFKESTANISHFTLTDGYVAVVGPLNTAGGVPEPTTWALSILGFFGAGAMLRRQRRVAVTA